jgi:hypothetical protein
MWRSITNRNGMFQSCYRFVINVGSLPVWRFRDLQFRDENVTLDLVTV